MQIDAAAPVTARPLEIETAAAAAETDGYDGFGVPETRHDVFASLALAARRTSRITLQSAIAVAFARNPMNVAVQANDIQLISHGRFQLGLGSQVRPHIERRFGMPWSHPASRMEEFIGAVRAIWECWATGGRLAFRGEFYHHTLMTEFFNPGPNPFGNPPILLAAVGELMTGVSRPGCRRDVVPQLHHARLSAGADDSGAGSGPRQVGRLHGVVAGVRRARR